MIIFCFSHLLFISSSVGNEHNGCYRTLFLIKAFPNGFCSFSEMFHSIMVSCSLEDTRLCKWLLLCLTLKALALLWMVFCAVGFVLISMKPCKMFIVLQMPVFWGVFSPCPLILSSYGQLVWLANCNFSVVVVSSLQRWSCAQPKQTDGRLHIEFNSRFSYVSITIRSVNTKHNPYWYFRPEIAIEDDHIAKNYIVFFF